MATDVKVTRNCKGCGKGTHLVQDSSGSYWSHDLLIDEELCWRKNRAMYESGELTYEDSR